MRTLRVVALIACFASPLALANTVPSRVEMTIEVETRGMTVGEGRDVFEHDGKRYSVTTEARTAGIARLFKRVEEKRESRGLIGAQGLKPLTFKQQRTGKQPNGATFDYDKNQLTIQEGNETEVVALQPYTLDATSLTYAFVFGELPKGDKFTVHVTDGRKLSEYKVALLGREKLKTKMGELDTLHYKKIQDPDDKRGFEFWLAVDQHRLPVRIRIIEKDGSNFDSNVTKIEFAEKP